MDTKERSKISLARGAILCLLCFPFAVTALGLIQVGHYSSTNQAMSELVLGRGGQLMTVAFVLLGVGTATLGYLLHSALPKARVAPALILLAAMLDLVTAIFHTNGSGPDTTGSKIHMIAGISTFLLMIIAMFTSVRAFRRDPRFKSFAWPTLIWAIATIPTFFLIPILGDTRFGLGQRTFVAVWLSWLIVLGIRMEKLA